MPSQSNPTEYDNASASASSSYSKEDLQTIYEIICLATIVPSDYAFRCIWRAYETVLRYKDIDPAHDSKYFRVLINLGGGGSLLDKFKAFLRENGFDASTVEHLNPPDSRLVSLYTRSRFLEAKDRRDRTISTASNSPGDDDGDTGDYTNSSNTSRNQRKGYNSTRRQERREARELRQEEPASRGLRRSNLKQANLAYTSPLSRLTSSSGSPDSQSTDSRDRTTSEEQVRLKDNAEFVRNISLSQKYFRLWQHRVVEQAEHRRELEHIAAAHDNRVLGRAALTEWLFLTKERQTENARNIYLIGAAFSTWAHKTAAIINRSNEMRQRIMARKYFNTWRSIVLENNAKIQRFQLSCAIYRWRMALFRRRQAEERAIQVYKANLVNRFRRVWWYRACEAVAPGLHNNFLMHEALSTWRQQTSAMAHNQLVADRLNRGRLANRVFQHWLERTDDYLDLEENAVDHRDWSLTRRHLNIWRQQTGYAPAVAHTAARINRRLATNILANWRLRCRQSLAAAAFLKANTFKHILRIWDLHLRHNFLVVQQERRILVDALYSWVLQTRYQIFTRNVKNWFLAKNALLTWRQRTRRILRERRNNNHNAIYSLKRHLLSKFFHTWRSRLAEEATREANAESHRRTVLVPKALRIWTARVRDIIILQSWVEPAHRYLLIRNHLNLWRNALQSVKRNKIKSAYKEFYRFRRRRLLASVMNHWYSRTQTRRAMVLSAEDFNSSRIALIAQRTLEIWHGRLARVDQLKETQQSWNNPPLMNSALDKWLLYLEHLANLGGLAQSYRNERLILIAATLFRRWQTKVFILRTRETTAELLSDRIEKRRLVGLVRRWVERARSKEEMRRFEERLEEEEGFQGGQSTHWLNRSRFQQHDESNDSLGVDEVEQDEQPDVSPTPTPNPLQHINHFSSGTSYRSSRRDQQPSEDLIDLETPFPGAGQSLRLSPLRSPARSLPRRERTQSTRNTPFLGSIPPLQPNIRSSLFGLTPARPGPQKLLQTPRERAVRASEVLFKTTPAPFKFLQTPAQTSGGLQSQARTVPEGVTEAPPRTPSPPPRIPTPVGGVQLNLEEFATPAVRPQKASSGPRSPADLWLNLLSSAARLNTTRSVRFTGLTPARNAGLGRSLFGQRDPPGDRSSDKGKERETSPPE
ncbi:Sfi1 spindle body protein-domain-containing protein [Terfezia claveryi]|nr:Sfi1 spindle body protein-domain-containing protein [Terfezia claveryi]